MNLKELFDVLDPETWQQRPLTKVFVFQATDWTQLGQEELRQVLFMKITKWAGDNLDKIDLMNIETFIDEVTMAPCIQLRFTLKKVESKG